jgi:hypothetical protein
MKGFNFIPGKLVNYWRPAIGWKFLMLAAKFERFGIVGIPKVPGLFNEETLEND